MPEPSSILTFNRIRDLYQILQLPTDQIEENSEFDIHRLSGVHTTLPFQSPVFRANYFSFVFVKNAIGRDTTGEQLFTTQPGTIYFTNPGHQNGPPVRGRCIKQGDWASGVTVNTIIPFAVDHAGIFEDPASYPDLRKQLLDSCPMHRLAEVEDVVNVAEFFASDPYSFVSGQHLLVNGGATN